MNYLYRAFLLAICTPLVVMAQQNVHSSISATISAMDQNAYSTDHVLIASAADPAGVLPVRGVVDSTHTPSATINNIPVRSSHPAIQSVNTAQVVPGQPLLPTGVVERPSNAPVTTAIPSPALAVHAAPSAHGAAPAVSTAFPVATQSTTHKSSTTIGPVNATSGHAATSSTAAAPVAPAIAPMGEAKTRQTNSAQHESKALNPNTVLHSHPTKTAKGHYQIDLVVTDEYGNPVTGLSAQDLEIKDNEQLREVQSFIAVNANAAPAGMQASAAPTETPTAAQTPVPANTNPPASNPPAQDPAVEMVLVLDAVNTDPEHLTLVRAQTEKFLRQNGGQLAQPTSLVLFSSAGVTSQEQAITDGNALADMLAKYGDNLPAILPVTGKNIAAERIGLSKLSFKQIIAGETKKPGRKQLIWLGPGWPPIQEDDAANTPADKTHQYGEIEAFTNQLREARVAVYNIRFMNEDGTIDSAYEDYLQGVSSKDQADAAHLALQVLAVNSGGRVLETTNDILGQIARCESDARAYYTVSFNSNELEAPSAFSYHQLTVHVKQPGMTARTNTSYYAVQ